MLTTYRLTEPRRNATHGKTKRGGQGSGCARLGEPGDSDVASGWPPRGNGALISTHLTNCVRCGHPGCFQVSCFGIAQIHFSITMNRPALLRRVRTFREATARGSLLRINPARTTAVISAQSRPVTPPVSESVATHGCATHPGDRPGSRLCTEGPWWPRAGILINCPRCSPGRGAMISPPFGVAEVAPRIPSPV